VEKVCDLCSLKTKVATVTHTLQLLYANCQTCLPGFRGDVNRVRVVTMGNYPLQDVCLAVICGTPVIATICTGLRILARRRIGAKLMAGKLSFHGA
jgi:hypothetical protein